MAEFTVRVKGVHDDGQAGWVLAVDPEAGLLVIHEDKTLHWHPLEDCTFSRLREPGTPQPVFVMQPAEPAKKPHPLLVPNRTARRELQRNGPA